MAVPASTKVLQASSGDLISVLAANRLLLKDAIEFLFRADRRTAPLFVLSGDFGMFLAGAAAQAGIDNIVVDDVVMGNIDPDFKKVIVISDKISDATNPADKWREVSRKLFPRKERGVLIEARCLKDERSENTSPKASSVENTEMIAVKSMASLLTS